MNFLEIEYVFINQDYEKFIYLIKTLIISSVIIVFMIFFLLICVTTYFNKNKKDNKGE